MTWPACPTPAIRTNDCSAGQNNCQRMKPFFRKDTARSCVRITTKLMFHVQQDEGKFLAYSIARSFKQSFPVQEE